MTMLRVCLATALLLCSSAVAQESPGATAATTPAPFATIGMQRFTLQRFGDDPTGLERDVREFRAITTISYGVARDMSLTLTQPIVYADSSVGAPPGSTSLHTTHDTHIDDASSSTFGLDDAELMFKWRVWQKDFGPIDTSRLALLAGINLPWGDRAFSSRSFDPTIGIVWTHIHDRHGVNVGARYRFNFGDDDAPYVIPGTGAHDAFYFEAAYLYRIAPARFDAHNSHGAWYVILEANSVVEMNGDRTIIVAPGLMYEAANFALELSVQLPVDQDVTNRPELDYGVLLGLRIFF
jgi:hypothetical protein